MIFDTITPEFIRQQMAKIGLDRKTLGEELSLHMGDLSDYLNSKKEVPASRKAQIYWYFEAKKHESAAKNVDVLLENTLYHDYESIMALLWSAQARLQNMRDYGRDWFTTTDSVPIEVDMDINHLTEEEQALLAVYEQAEKALLDTYLAARYAQKHY